MAKRKSKEELIEIQESLGVDRLWSWSRYKCYKDDKYTYYLQYIAHEPADCDNNIYSVSGAKIHDIIQSFYDGSIKYDDMITCYDDAVVLMDTLQLKYDRSDAEKNFRIASKYESCVKHFCLNHIPITGQYKTEQFVLLKVSDDIYFQGYIDFIRIYKDVSNRIHAEIIDWKSSSIYTGGKINKESGQMLLYAEAVRQSLKLPLEQIHCKWNFIKYVEVQYQRSNCQWATRIVARNQIGFSLSNSIRMWLRKEGYSENLVDEVISANSLDSLPESVKSHFIISDCYIEVPVAEASIEKLKRDVDVTIREITKKEEETKNAPIEKRDLIWWQDVNENDVYRLNVLSCYSRKKHKPLDAYLKEQEERKQKDQEAYGDVID